MMILLLLARCHVPVVADLSADFNIPTEKRERCLPPLGCLEQSHTCESFSGITSTTQLQLAGLGGVFSSNRSRLLAVNGHS